MKRRSRRRRRVRRAGTHDEAERKPRVALDDMGGIVATVMALAGDALVALDLFAEGMLAASED